MVTILKTETKPKSISTKGKLDIVDKTYITENIPPKQIDKKWHFCVDFKHGYVKSKRNTQSLPRVQPITGRFQQKRPFC
jgi:hypothetical protein